VSRYRTANMSVDVGSNNVNPREGIETDWAQGTYSVGPFGRSNNVNPREEGCAEHKEEDSQAR